MSDDRISQLEAELAQLREDDAERERQERHEAEQADLQASMKQFMSWQATQTADAQAASTYHAQQMAALESGDVASALARITHRVEAGLDPNRGGPAPSDVARPTTRAEYDAAIAEARAAGDDSRVGALLMERGHLGAEVRATPAEMAAIDARIQELLAIPASEDPHGHCIQEISQLVAAMYYPEEMRVAAPPSPVDERTFDEKMQDALDRGDVTTALGLQTRDLNDRLNHASGVA